jgi:hypothetical protein
VLDEALDEALVSDNSDDDTSPKPARDESSRPQRPNYPSRLRLAIKRPFNARTTVPRFSSVFQRMNCVPRTPIVSWNRALDRMMAVELVRQRIYRTRAGIAVVSLPL